MLTFFRTIFQQQVNFQHKLLLKHIKNSNCIWQQCEHQLLNSCHQKKHTLIVISKLVINLLLFAIEGGFHIILPRLCLKKCLTTLSQNSLKFDVNTHRRQFS